MRLITFGDSWTAGHGIETDVKYKEEPFPHMFIQKLRDMNSWPRWVSDKLKCEYVNLGVCGYGNEYILKDLKETVENGQHFVFQDGKTVFKYAVSGMADVSEKIMQRNNLTKDDVNWLIAHQANKRIIDATASRMGVDEEKVLVNIEKYGNTTSATLPLLLSDFEHKFKKGDNLIFAAFGGGFTWGSIYLKWAY
mgnify:CR=1 FL=1